MICTVATQEGRKTFTPDAFTIMRAKVVEKKPLPTRGEFRRLLMEHIGITL
jgi:hypothetical protein